MIVNDFREAEKSFTEELGLRMMFEDKIGSLHFIYREIIEKHGKLIREFKAEMILSNDLKNQMEKLRNEMESVKIEKWGAEQERNDLKQRMIILEEQLHRE